MAYSIRFPFIGNSLKLILRKQAKGMNILIKEKKRGTGHQTSCDMHMASVVIK